GIFSFNLAEAKEYKLEIRKPGYLTKKVDFSLADCAVEDEVPIEPEDIEDGTLEGAAGSTLTCDQINCDDLNPCTQDVCEDSACNYTQLSDVPCGDKGTCQEGACVEPKTKTTPPVTTGFLGLSGLQEQVAMGLGILIILGILFVGWTKFK
ncbi:hypothetical protein KKG83_07105, partial [Candidatus Micrarchaeota archaeon]|nr:hypothetical protein [Candidatus Micrarchaeota archaeon]